MSRNTIHDVWSRVDMRRTDECWPWTGARNTKGYGQMRVNFRQHPTHRLAFWSATGVDPGALLVLHSCDNPPCCNPEHLFLGTAADNIRDCAAKGRNRKGDTHPQAKLSTLDVTIIRRRHAHGEQGIEIARDFGVTPTTISHIVRRHTWRHV